MSLTVTVQKGHDFASGNVTRAALNAGATPTVSVIGAVGSTEIAEDAVTATELQDDSSTDGNRAVTTNHVRDLAITEAKLANDAVALTKIKTFSGQGRLIVGGSGGNPEELQHTASGNLLIGTGTTCLSMPLDSNSDVTITEDNSDVLISLADNKVTPAKIAHDEDSNPGFLAYGASGTPLAVTTANTGQILLTQGAAAPALKYHHKVIDVHATAVKDTWLTAAHGITCTGTNYPHLVTWYFQCITAEHGYAIGDRVYAMEQHYRDSAHINTVYVDGTNVGININLLPYLREKTTNTVITGITAANWKVVAVVSEM